MPTLSSSCPKKCIRVPLTSRISALCCSVSRSCDSSQILRFWESVCEKNLAVAVCKFGIHSISLSKIHPMTSLKKANLTFLWRHWTNFGNTLIYCCVFLRFLALFCGLLSWTIWRHCFNLHHWHPSDKYAPKVNKKYTTLPLQRIKMCMGNRKRN